jgi:hypothetical protein
MGLYISQLKQGAEQMMAQSENEAGSTIQAITSSVIKPLFRPLRTNYKSRIFTNAALTILLGNQFTLI